MDNSTFFHFAWIMAKYKLLFYDLKSIVPICSQSLEIIEGWCARHS